MQGIEGMEKFLLGRGLIAQGLDIINEEQIQIAVGLLEIIHVIETQVFQKVIDKGLRGHIFDTGMGIIHQNLISDGVKQMRFSQTRTTKDKKRVVEST